MTNRKGSSMIGPFTVQTFTSIGVTTANVERDGEFFMQVETIEGATLMAALLNSAVALAARSDLMALESGDDWRSLRIAAAVAKALGGEIDHGSFSA